MTLAGVIVSRLSTFSINGIGPVRIRLKRNSAVRTRVDHGHMLAGLGVLPARTVIADRGRFELLGRAVVIRCRGQLHRAPGRRGYNLAVPGGIFAARDVAYLGIMHGLRRDAQHHMRARNPVHRGFRILSPAIDQNAELGLVPGAHQGKVADALR